MQETPLSTGLKIVVLRSSLDSICAFGIFCWPMLFLKDIYNRLTFFSYNKQIILYKNIYDARTQHRVVVHAKLLLHRVLFSRETHFYDHFSCFWQKWNIFICKYLYVISNGWLLKIISLHIVCTDFIGILSF